MLHLTSHVRAFHVIRAARLRLSSYLSTQRTPVPRSRVYVTSEKYVEPAAPAGAHVRQGRRRFRARPARRRGGPADHGRLLPAAHQPQVAQQRRVLARHAGTLQEWWYLRPVQESAVPDIRF